LLQDTSYYFLFITEDASQTPVAFVKWNFFKGRTEKEWADTWVNRQRTDKMNKELMDATSGARLLKRAKIFGDKDVLCE